MTKKLKIAVAGETSTGKSTVCYLIKRCLKENGFNVDFDGGVDYENDIEFDENVSRDIDKKIELLSQEVNIELNEIQLNREPV